MLIMSIMLLGNVIRASLMMIGTTELFIIAAIVLLLFGGKKIPELMRSLGQGVRFFKKGMNEDSPEELSQKKPVDDNEVKLPDEK